MSKSVSSPQALIFLFTRTFVNGIRRALTTPKRLINLVLVCAYYFYFFIRPTGAGRSHIAPDNMPHFSLPSMNSIDGVVFCVFGALSIFMLMSVTSYRGSFKPADVDVLFATPVSPKVVMVFRLIRDYIATLLLPLFFAIIGWRGTNVGLKYVVTQLPNSSGLVFRAATVAWILLALSFVTLGYALSMFVNRTDNLSGSNRRNILIAQSTFVVGIVAWIVWSLKSDPTLDGVQNLSHSILMRTLLPGATAATALVMAPLKGDLVLGSLGFVGLIGLSFVSYRVALTQTGWLYDQAAAKGFDNLRARNLQRQGDTFSLIGERARAGRLRKSRLAKKLSSSVLRGGPALVWKESLLQLRALNSVYWLLGLMFAVIAGFILVQEHRPKPGPEIGLIIWFFQGMGVFMLTAGVGQSASIELLRRGDFQKPLPFTPTQTVFWETAARAIMPSIVLAPIALVSIAVLPGAWQSAVSGLIAVPTVALNLSSCVLFSYLLFPDVEDMTQRSLRSLVSMLSVVIVSAPGLGLVALAIYFGAMPLLAIVPLVIVNLGISFLICLVTGMLYAGYSPNE